MGVSTSSTLCDVGTGRGPRGNESSGSESSSIASAADIDTTPNVQLVNTRVHMLVPLAVVLVSLQNALP